LRDAVGFGRRHHAIHQADFERGLGHERLAQQQRFGRAVVTQHLRHQQACCKLNEREPPQ
jgi:hypothetical protein